MEQWPDSIRPTNMTWHLNSNAKVFQSPFNGASQTVTYPGSAWSAELTFENLNDWESRQLEALLCRLDGPGGRILIGDHGRWGRAAKGTPVVSGDQNKGNLLATTGWLPSQKILWAGDYISIDNELKMVLADCYSAVNGSATIEVGPMLRKTPAAGAKIETMYPVGVFRLANNKNGVSREPAFNNKFTVSFVEVF